MLQNLQTFSGLGLYDLIFVLSVFFTAVIMIFLKRFPDALRLRSLIAILDDRGGNILVLMLMSGWFFSASLRLFYFAFTLMAQKNLSADNAILLMALQFVTGAAFGGAFGAMLKTMHGNAFDANANTTSTTTTTPTPKTPAPPDEKAG